MKKLSLIIAIVLIASVGLNIHADTKPKRDGKKGKGIIKKLNLTDDQITKFKDMRYELESKLLELKYTEQKNQLEIKVLLKNTPIDKIGVMELINKNSQIKSEMKLLIVDNWFKVYEILDSEQQKIWIEHFEGMGKPMRNNLNYNGDFKKKLQKK
ncbi:MAG: hypothetical protein JW866_06045 [Ignavibacteriales bacterium]|nr:hypothetical protein [Ignavibacteriales bacterium]